MERQYWCNICLKEFTQVGTGRPRQVCPSCKQTTRKRPAGNGPKLPKTRVTIGSEEIPGRIERTTKPMDVLSQGTWTTWDSVPGFTADNFRLALRIVRDVAAGRPCHQAALDALRRIEG